MRIEEAWKLLQGYAEQPREIKIAEIYDEPCVSTAILTLHPKFEYPDWDQRHITEFLKYCSIATPQFHISRHEARLKDVIEIEKHAWQLGKNDNGAALECLISDLLFYCDEFDLNAATVLARGKAMFNRKRKEAKQPARKKKEPPPISAGYKENFETLGKACADGNLALMSVIRKADQQPVVVVCAVNRLPEGGADFVPLAEMCDKNPYEAYEPPTGEG